MARTRQKAIEIAPIEGNGTVAVAPPLVVNPEPEAPKPKPARKPRPRKVPQPTPAPVFDGLTVEAETLRRQLGEAGQQAEEMRALMQALRQQHEELRSEFHEAARLSDQAEARFRQSAEQLIHELRGQLEPLTQRLSQAAPHLEHFPEQARQVLQRLDHAAQTLPDAMRQLQRLEQQNQEAERRLADLREQAAQEESRLELMRSEGRELEGQLHEKRTQIQEVEEKAKAVVAEADAETPPEPPRLGLTVAPGIVVDEVQADSAAQAAGLLVGDVIHSVNGTQVHDDEELLALLRDAKGGEAIVLTVCRAGQDVELTANPSDPTTETPEAAGRPWLGLTVHPGLVVEEVMPGSPAEAAGLARGDVIQSANGSPVNAAEQLRQAAQEAGSDSPPAQEADELLLEVSRSGQRREVNVSLGA